MFGPFKKEKPFSSLSSFGGGVGGFLNKSGGGGFEATGGNSTSNFTQDGIDYNFLEINNFKNKINNGEFIEYEEVYHNVFYGTLKSDVKKLLQNHNVIFDVDVVGAISLKKYFSDKALTIFINPPSLKVLEDRLNQRGLNSQDDLQERINKAKKEIEMKSTFDYSITNDDIEKAKSNIFEKVKGFLNI